MATKNVELVPNKADRASQYDDPELVATIKATVCKGATDMQLRMFLEVCKRTGLDPFLREIWFVAQTGVIMAARDGYLRVANEHPQFDGMETRVERDEKNIPIKATCTVWRKDRAHPTICEAFYNEYVKSSQVWQQYKSAMIGKIAEVLALKRTFAINGVVTEEEIGYTQDAPKNIAGGWDVEGEQRAKQVAEAKLAAMKAGASYEDVSSPDPRRQRETEPLNSARDPFEDAEHTTDPFPPPDPPFNMAKSIAEFDKLHILAVEKLGQERGDRLYYKVLGDHGVKHSNELKHPRPARDCYRSLAREIDAALQTIGPMLVPSHVRELTTALEKAGPKSFFKVLGSSGYDSITAVPADAVPGIIADLQQSGAFDTPRKEQAAK